MNIDQLTSNYEVRKLQVRPKAFNIYIRAFMASFIFEVDSMSCVK